MSTTDKKASDSPATPRLHIRGSQRGGGIGGFFVYPMEPIIEVQKLIWITLPDGHSFSAPVEDEKEIRRDPCAYAAQYHGVSRHIMAAWIAHNGDCAQCSGITKKGQRCRSRGESYPTLAGFIDGISNRCSVHSEAKTEGNS